MGLGSTISTGLGLAAAGVGMPWIIGLLLAKTGLDVLSANAEDKESKRRFDDNLGLNKEELALREKKFGEDVRRFDTNRQDKLNSDMRGFLQNKIETIPQLRQSSSRILAADAARKTRLQASRSQPKAQPQGLPQGQPQALPSPDVGRSQPQQEAVAFV